MGHCLHGSLGHGSMPVTHCLLCNEAILRQARLVLGWVTVFGRGIPPRYETIHPGQAGQLSLLHSAGREMGTALPWIRHWLVLL